MLADDEKAEKVEDALTAAAYLDLWEESMRLRCTKGPLVPAPVPGKGRE